MEFIHSLLIDSLDEDSQPPYKAYIGRLLFVFKFLNAGYCVEI